MKNYLRIGFALLVFAVTSAEASSGGCCGCSSSSTAVCNGECNEYGTILIPRSLGDRLDWQNHYFNYKFDEDCIYGNFLINYEYMGSFRNERPAQYLLGSQSLHFTGSQVANRGPNDLLADNFGMATDTDAWITFCPKLKNQIVDFQLYVGLNELCDGLYFQVNLPLVHANWNLNDTCNCCDGCATNASGDLSTTPFPAGYMSSQTTTPQTMPDPVTPNTTFLAALSGTRVGDMAQDWGYGKFFGCNCTETKLASLNFDLGYNFYECEDYHVGIYARVVAPTGTEIDEDHATCIFRPTIGDDHWKLGGGLAAHARLYSCDDESHIFDMYMQGYAVHLFEREQTRSFDLNNGRLSRYMLLKEFDADGKYTGKLYNAIDYATRRVKVSVGVQGEGVIGFLYKNECGLRAGIGYNIYGKSREKICGICSNCNSTIASKNLGIKGNTPLQAQFYEGDNVAHTVIAPVANQTYKLNGTESGATAFATATVDNAQGIGSTGFVPGLAPRVLAVVDGYNNTLPTTTLTDLTAIPAVTSSSTPITAINNTTYALTTDTPAPFLLTDRDLNLHSACVPSQVTNRVYGHLDYEWTDCDWSPMLRLGAEVELASCSDLSAINLWGVMIQGSVSF